MEIEVKLVVALGGEGVVTGSSQVGGGACKMGIETDFWDWVMLCDCVYFGENH